ncbi:MAG TPA: ATPase [Lachnospiraceae bacterium]|jgi:hypothetical protein|nr:ATPase [Lachnospiraceae bacterium]
MNIKEAKEEIIHTVQAYTAKDENGQYLIPVEKQRPMLLIGPPGIGKTAILEQAARQLHINLVSYTITHHTRQSAIGLPRIEQRSFEGKEYQVTEYTMSEIIAAIYEQIEKSGVKEGILFLDEINCVSETLAPTMLQFLQYKTFGTHRVPDGFVIVTAGNPPQYNKSVRDFDIVTLDRVRRINIEADFDVWKEYAYDARVHGAILAYLEIRKDHFYSIRTEVEERYFVTARGWEDLSELLYAYEKLGIRVTGDVVGEYLQDPEIAKDFVTYYELYDKYKNLYQIPEILTGSTPKMAEQLSGAPFDEKISVMSLLIDALNNEFTGYVRTLEVQKVLLSELNEMKTSLKAQKGKAVDLIRAARQEREERLAKNLDAHMVTRDEEKIERLSLTAMAQLEKKLMLDGTGGEKSDFELARNWFEEREAKRQESVKRTGEHLTNCFAFLARTFGEGQEMVLFLSELSADRYALRFVTDNGNEAWYKYNQLLLLRDRREDLRQEVLSLSGRL